VVKNGYIDNDVAKEQLVSRIDTNDQLHEEDISNGHVNENIESFYSDVNEKTQQMLKYPENLKEKISKQDIESLIEDGDYTTILTIYDFLFDPPEQKIAEHHSPEHKQKVEKLKGKLDFLFQNDHYDIIDKLCQIVDQLYGNKMPEPELTESKNKPNDPALWSRAKAAAKKKFDVYPSAYANAWASKWYKEKGGTWRKGKK
jgi:hypothetical protein